MAPAKIVARKLREFLNENNWTVSDVRRGLVVIVNGRLTDNPVSKVAPHHEAQDAEFCHS